MEETTVLFDEYSGVLKTVAVKGKPTSISNFPFVAMKRTDSVRVSMPLTSSTKASITEKDSSFIIEANNINGFEKLKWTIKVSGEIRLEYSYAVTEGFYEYSGIGMKVSAKAIKSKRWLGEGPTRIWKNRTEGGLYDVYAGNKLVNIPGEVYNQPEFEGCFAPWKWVIFHLDDNVSIGFQNNSDVVLGVLNPINGDNPQMATWKYPEQEGFYFFNVIPAIGSKWKKPTEFGPDAQPDYIKDNQSGSISFFINWNNEKSDDKTFKISIE